MEISQPKSDYEDRRDWPKVTLDITGSGRKFVQCALIACTRVESAVSLNDIRRSTMIELNESINGNRSTMTDFMCTELEILLN